jgi:hypothetical protein
VRNLRARLTLPLPFVSAFEEINVRTYVTVNGQAGIHFFSLDAASTLAVAAARRAYRLPYFHARASAVGSDGGVRFASERTSAEAPVAA